MKDKIVKQHIFNDDCFRFHEGKMQYRELLEVAGSVFYSHWKDVTATTNALPHKEP